MNLLSDFSCFLTSRLFFIKVNICLAPGSGASHLVCVHGLPNPVTRSFVNNLQPLVNGGFEPVMKTRQSQHFGVPAGEQRRVPLVWVRTDEEQILLGFYSFISLFNQLERKKLSKAFEDFQRHEQLVDGLAHCLCQSGALLFQCPAHALHCNIHVVCYLKHSTVQCLSASSQTHCSSSTVSELKRIPPFNVFKYIPASPAACILG